MAEGKTYVKKKKTNFQRTKFRAYVKLGKGQKSKQKYRKATGRHNKTRQKWKSRPPRVEIGYKNKVSQRHLINEKYPVVITNLKELKNVKENQIVILGKVGAKKKLELIKEAEKLKIEILNINSKKFKRKIDRKTKHKQKIKEERAEKLKKSEKKKESKKDEKKDTEEEKKEDDKKDTKEVKEDKENKK